MSSHLARFVVERGAAFDFTGHGEIPMHSHGGGAQDVLGIHAVEFAIEPDVDEAQLLAVGPEDAGRIVAGIDADFVQRLGAEQFAAADALDVFAGLVEVMDVISGVTVDHEEIAVGGDIHAGEAHAAVALKLGWHGVGLDVQHHLAIERELQDVLATETRAVEVLAAFGLADHESMKIVRCIGYVAKVIALVVVNLHTGLRAALHTDVHFVLGTHSDIAVHVADLFFAGGHGGPEFFQRVFRANCRPG